MTLAQIAFLIQSLVIDTPQAELYKSDEAREILALEFLSASEEHSVDPVLLVIMGYRESSFRQGSRGDLGEIGVMQVHGQSRKICEASGLDIKSRLDNIRCGALLIAMNTRYCGSLNRGLYRYACGKCRGSPRAIRKMNWRLKLAEKWKAVTRCK